MSDTENPAFVEEPLDYASLRRGKRIDLAQAVPLPAPLAVYVEPTNICNFRCVFCPESFMEYEDIAGGLFKLAPDDFERIASQIIAIGGVQTLNFYMMGEPFANRNLFDYIRIAKERSLGRKLILTSNGSLLKKDHYTRLCQSGLDYLRISIYGPNEDAHRKNTGSTVKLARIRENVAGLKAFRDEHGYATPHIYVKMIESDRTEENTEFLGTFQNVGDEVGLEPVMNWNDPDQGNLSGIDSDRLQDQGYFANKKTVCPFPFYTLVIHSDLKVSACCVDWDKKIIIGDLRTQTLREIWRGEALHALQLAHLEGRRRSLPGCNNCTYLYTAPDNLDALSASDFLERTMKANT